MIGPGAMKLGHKKTKRGWIATVEIDRIKYVQNRGSEIDIRL